MCLIWGTKRKNISDKFGTKDALLISDVIPDYARMVDDDEWRADSFA